MVRFHFIRLGQGDTRGKSGYLCRVFCSSLRLAIAAAL